MTSYIFSGIDRAKFFEVLAREGAAGMVNCMVAEQSAMLAAYERWPDTTRVLDSAAFQGNTDLLGYAATVRRVGKYFKWCTNLDVIGNQKKSNENWFALKGHGVEALWVYQVEGGSNLDYMQRQAGSLEFIGIGGLVPVVKRSTQEAFDLIGEVGRRLEAAGAKAHLFGINTPAVIREFAGYPWFESADSRAWLVGFQAQELITRDGGRLATDKAGLLFSREECAQQNIRTIHSWLTRSDSLQLSFDL